MMIIKKEELKSASWLLIWLSLNVGLTLLNKACFISFPYALTVSFVHYLCSALGAAICMRLGNIEKTYPDSLEYQKLLLFSTIFNINIILGNASIKVVSVALSQTVRAISPATTMLISFLILGTTFSLRIWISVVPVIVGMILACYGDVENITIWSLTILISGCFASGLKIVMTKVLLSGSHRYHPFDLLQKVTPLCAIQLTPVILYLEYSGLRVDDSVNLSQWMVVFATGIMAFSLNIANFFTNRVVSPLTLTVAGNLKQVLTILLSIFIFSTKITPLNGIGIFVTILGGAGYSFITYIENNRLQPLLPKTESA